MKPDDHDPNPTDAGTAYLLEAAGVCRGGTHKGPSGDAMVCRPDLGLFAAIRGSAGWNMSMLPSRLLAVVLETLAGPRPTLLPSEVLPETPDWLVVFDPTRPHRDHVNAFGFGVGSLYERSEDDGRWHRCAELVHDDMWAMPRLPRLLAGCEAVHQALVLLALRGIKDFEPIASCVVALFDHTLTVAHVGNGRAYRLRDGTLVALTRDHLLFETLVESGQLSREDAAQHPLYALRPLTRILGHGDSSGLEVTEVAVRGGDVLLLCSAGLHTAIEDAAIASVVAGPGTLEARCEALVAAAQAVRPADDVTAVLVEVG